MQEKTFYIQKNSNENEKYSCAISKTAGKPFCKTNPKNKTTVKKKKQFSKQYQYHRFTLTIPFRFIARNTDRNSILVTHVLLDDKPTIISFNVMLVAYYISIVSTTTVCTVGYKPFTSK